MGLQCDFCQLVVFRASAKRWAVHLVGQGLQIQGHQERARSEHILATRTWNKDRAAKRIDAKIGELPLKDIEIKEYVRDTDLTNLSSNVAYRLDGVHLYADILNLSDMLHLSPRGLRFGFRILAAKDLMRRNSERTVGLYPKIGPGSGTRSPVHVNETTRPCQALTRRSESFVQQSRSVPLATVPEYWYPVYGRLR